MKAMVALKPKIGLVTEPLASKPLREVMDWVVSEAPEISGLEGRTSTRSFCPASMRARATAEPTKPLAPVTSVRSLVCIAHLHVVPKPARPAGYETSLDSGPQP